MNSAQSTGFNPNDFLLDRVQPIGHSQVRTFPDQFQSTDIFIVWCLLGQARSIDSLSSGPPLRSRNQMGRCPSELDCRSSCFLASSYSNFTYLAIVCPFIELYNTSVHGLLVAHILPFVYIGLEPCLLTVTSHLSSLTSAPGPNYRSLWDQCGGTSLSILLRIFFLVICLPSKLNRIQINQIS